MQHCQSYSGGTAAGVIITGVILGAKLQWQYSQQKINNRLLVGFVFNC